MLTLLSRAKARALRASTFALFAIATHAAFAVQALADAGAGASGCSLKQLGALEVAVYKGEVVLPVELDGHAGIMSLRPDTANIISHFPGTLRNSVRTNLERAMCALQAT